MANTKPSDIMRKWNNLKEQEKQMPPRQQSGKRNWEYWAELYSK